MVPALWYLGISIGVFLLLSLLYSIEDKKGDRVILKGFRALLDGVFLAILARLFSLMAFFTHGFMRLLLHYSAHKILKRIQTTLQRLEQKIEALVRHNRRIAKTIKEEAKEKNHLHAIAEHKEEVALSEKEKEERLSR